jgi:hypothetical protein
MRLFDCSCPEAILFFKALPVRRVKPGVKGVFSSHPGVKVAEQ